MEKIVSRLWPLVQQWLYLFFLVAASVYAYFVWNKYLINSDWSESKKQQYIKEKSIFSFENKSYEQALQVTNLKREKLENGQRFGGRDIFNPDGF